MHAQEDSTIKSKPPSSIKLFVGQIPKAMNEDDLVPIFAPFGTIFELSIIRFVHAHVNLFLFCSLHFFDFIYLVTKRLGYIEDVLS